MAVPFILLGGAALAGITGAVKSVSAHTKNANAKQIVAEAQNIYDEAREMLEEQRTCTAECLKRLGVLNVCHLVCWCYALHIRILRIYKILRSSPGTVIVFCLSLPYDSAIPLHTEVIRCRMPAVSSPTCRQIRHWVPVKAFAAVCHIRLQLCCLNVLKQISLGLLKAYF